VVRAIIILRLSVANHDRCRLQHKLALGLPPSGLVVAKAAAARGKQQRQEDLHEKRRGKELKPS
jgi:hypothetical protein